MTKRHRTYQLLALTALWLCSRQAVAQVAVQAQVPGPGPIQIPPGQGPVQVQQGNGSAQVTGSQVQGKNKATQIPNPRSTAKVPGDQVQGKNPAVQAISTPSPRLKPNLVIAPAKEAATKVSDGDYLGALQVWSRVIQLGPDKLSGYLQRAKLKRQMGDNKGAVQDLDLALKDYPNSVACLVERAAIRRRINDYRGALEDLNKAIELQPHNADSYVDRGWLKMALGDYVGSVTDYHTAVTINPALKGKVGNLAQPQVGAHLDTDVSAIPPRAEHSGGNDDTNSGTAAYSGTQGNASGKKRVYSQAQLARLNNASVRQINDGQFEGAIKTLNELIAQAPDYAHARENLTIAHNNWGLELAKRTPAEAAKQFRQALYLDPSQGASRRNLDAMIREIGKNPKDADDRLALANESLSAADNTGAFVEASEAARLKNTPAVRAALRKALIALNEKDYKDEKADKAEKDPLWETTVLGQLKPMVKRNLPECSPKPVVSIAPHEDSPKSEARTVLLEDSPKSEAKPAPLEDSPKSEARTALLEDSPRPIVNSAQTVSSAKKVDLQTGEAPPLVVIEQAKAMAQAGQISGAEELLDQLINHIKSRAAVDESAGFEMLDLALDTLADLYLKTGSYVQAETNLSELVTLRESARDRGDPILGTTYRQYAKVLSSLNRAAEAKIYQDKADGLLDSKQANR